jgi:short-subunit dehydrogenase
MDSSGFSSSGLPVSIFQRKNDSSMLDLPSLFQKPKPTALITGGSSGIGKAFAEALVNEGFQVFATSRNPQTAPNLENVQWLKFEGSTAAECERFIELNSELLHGVDLLINNAGAGLFGRMNDHSADSINAQFQLLLHSPVALTLACLPHMQKRQSGFIVNVSSLASQLPLPYSTPYNSAKAALSSFTRSLILDSEQKRPYLIDFQPGDYKTPFNDNLKKSDAPKAFSGERIRAAWKAIELNLNAAPPPEKAAQDLLRALSSQRSDTFHSGDFFQAKVAPLAARLLPHRLVRKIIAAYYRLPAA